MVLVCLESLYFAPGHLGSAHHCQPRKHGGKGYLEQREENASSHWKSNGVVSGRRSRRGAAAWNRIGRGGETGLRVKGTTLAFQLRRNSHRLDNARIVLDTGAIKRSNPLKIYEMSGPGRDLRRGRENMLETKSQAVDATAVEGTRKVLARREGAVCVVRSCLRHRENMKSPKVSSGF